MDSDVIGFDMVLKIDVFMPPLSHYSVLHHFTKKLYEALKRQGAQSRLLEANRYDPGSFLKVLFEDPPDCTLSFNGLLPDDQGNFFCDLIKIPHISCLVDSPNSFVPLIQSPRTIIGCVDRFSLEFFNGLGFKRSFFFPHAVERDLSFDSSSKREYDVVLLASCIDWESIRKSWKSKFPRILCLAMEEAAELALTDNSLPYYQAFVLVLDRCVQEKKELDSRKVDFLSVLNEIEMYIRGKERTEMVKSIKEARVDIFGSSDITGGWKKYCGNKKNIVIHDPVPFEQAIDIMKHTKVLLNNCAWIKHGGHERIFAGLACGALPITEENPFLQQFFKDGESIAFYQYSRLDKANHRINEYISNSDKRIKVVEAGRQIVMKSHTWDQRAAELLQELPKLLKRIEI